MLCYIDIDERPDAEFFEDLDDWEVGQVLKEATEAEAAAEEWWMAASEELALRRLRRSRPAPPLFERLRAAEQRRLDRRRRKRPRRRRPRM